MVCATAAVGCETTNAPMQPAVHFGAAPALGSWNGTSVGSGGIPAPAPATTAPSKSTAAGNGTIVTTAAPPMDAGTSAAAGTGATAGPSLYHLMEVLGRGRTLARIDRALARPGW